MQGRAFLDVARDMAADTTEARWRTAAGRAYYALMLEGREALQRWGFPTPPRQNVHTFVRLRFRYAADPDLQAIGDALDRLARWRNQADYNLVPSALFASATIAVQAVTRAQRALDLLDRIDRDPVRRAAAIATIRP